MFKYLPTKSLTDERKKVFKKILLLIIVIWQTLFALSYDSQNIQWRLNNGNTLIIYPDTSHGPKYFSYSAIVLKGKIVTMDKNEAGEIKVIDNGRLVIAGERIAGVLSPKDPLPEFIDSADAIFFDTDGIIFPGLINAHDHVHYNCIPLWDVPKLYTNRYQWGDDKSHITDVKYPHRIISERKYFGLETESIKYGEVKQIVSGTTSVQGSPNGSKKFCRILVRNMDVSPNFGKDRMSSYVRPIKDVTNEKAEKWIAKMNSGELEAIFFHIAEGTDEKARAEFTRLVKLGLGRKESIIIHGTALKEPEIKYMAEHQMTLVWSPTSNLLLYGTTADIPTFKRYGVNIALGTDWSPSGGKNLLCEMKIAYNYARSKWGDVLTYRDIVEMVTVNPARAVGWSEYVGRLKPGFYADLVVIRDPGGDPFEALVNATERDVKLVFVGGNPLYGDCEYLRQLKPGDFEYIVTPCGFTKCIDITSEDVELGNELLKSIVDTLQLALNWDTTFMKTVFRDENIKKYKSFAEYLSNEFPGYHPIMLDPIYSSGDQYFFFILSTSKNARLDFDLQFMYYNW